VKSDCAWTWTAQLRDVTRERGQQRVNRTVVELSRPSVMAYVTDEEISRSPRFVFEWRCCGLQRSAFLMAVFFGLTSETVALTEGAFIPETCSI